MTAGCSIWLRTMWLPLRRLARRRLYGEVAGFGAVGSEDDFIGRIGVEEGGDLGARRGDGVAGEQAVAVAGRMDCRKPRKENGFIALVKNQIGSTGVADLVI